MPANTRVEAIIEVWDDGEEQDIRSSAALDIRWVHRKNYSDASEGQFARDVITALEGVDAQTFVWVACEKQDVRAVRSFLRDCGHNRKAM